MTACSVKLPNSLAVWGTDEFAHVLRSDLQHLDHTALPLQAGLTQSSFVSDSAFQVSLLRVADQPTQISVRVAVFYQGIIAGSCCSDDPTPVDEQPEYCELDVSIDKTTAEATIALVIE